MTTQNAAVASKLMSVLSAWLVYDSCPFCFTRKRRTVVSPPASQLAFSQCAATATVLGGGKDGRRVGGEGERKGGRERKQSVNSVCSDLFAMLSCQEKKMTVVEISAGKVLITFQRVAQDETSLRKRANKIANRTKGCTELRIR